MFGKFRQVVQTLTRAFAYVGMAFIVPMMLLTSTDAVARDVWSRPIRGSFEMSSFMLSVFVLLGLAYAQQMKDHVHVTILIDRLPRKWRDALRMFTTLLSMGIVAIMCWQGIVVAFESSAFSDMLRIPQLPFRLLVAVGGLFLFLEFLFDLVDQARSFLA
ncbi:MAG: TRAP transporter small permease [Desulfomonile sp.]|nr:TRAP transporter small permease [Desulfomonile sp.]